MVCDETNQTRLCLSRPIGAGVYKTKSNTGPCILSDDHPMYLFFILFFFFWPFVLFELIRKSCNEKHSQVEQDIRSKRNKQTNTTTHSCYSGGL